MPNWKLSGFHNLKPFRKPKELNGFPPPLFFLPIFLFLRKDLQEQKELPAFQVNSTQDDKLYLNRTKMFLIALVKRPITGCLTHLNSFLL